MKAASNVLKDLLLTSQKIFMADLYTITLTDGTVLRYTSCDVPLIAGGNKYAILAITRTGTTQTRGIDVDTLNITINTDVQDTLPGGSTFMHGIAAGSFDNAEIRLDRVFSPTPFRLNMPAISSDYILFWWLGIFNIDEAGGIAVKVKAASMTQLLNTKFPRNVYYPPCIYTLGDSECGVDLSKYKISGTVRSGSTRSQIAVDLSIADGYLNQGSITFTSGNNVNVTRTIRSSSGSQIAVILPFQNAPQAGDTFIAIPACNKSMNICNSIFHNLAHYRGYPFIPVPETAY